MSTTSTMDGAFSTANGPALTRMGYGTMQLADPGVWHPPGDCGELIAVLRSAVDAGVNHIDAFDFYRSRVTTGIIREALARYGVQAWMPTAPSHRPVPPALRWTRSFPGVQEQVCQARHWIEDLLPACDPLDELVLLASELCTNAVVHTHSGRPGGRFTVDVEWTSERVRVVVGDQGSPTAPAIPAPAQDATWAGECGRGLCLVDELADGWGTASHLGHRWVWIDVQWQAKGGPPLQTPGGCEAASADIAGGNRRSPAPRSGGATRRTSGRRPFQVPPVPTTWSAPLPRANYASCWPSKSAVPNGRRPGRGHSRAWPHPSRTVQHRRTSSNSKPIVSHRTRGGV